MGEAVPLVDRQGVHVGPEPDRRAVAQPTLDVAHHAGLGQAGVDGVAAEGGEPVGDESGGLVEVEIQLRDGMEMAAPAGDLVLHFGRTVQNGHRRLGLAVAVGEGRSRLASQPALCHLGVT